MHKRLFTSLLGLVSAFSLASAPLQADVCPNCYYPLDISYPAELSGCHVVTAMDVNYGLIQIQDGSRWQVASNDLLYLLSWNVYNPANGYPNLYVVITPNSYGSDYSFYLTNQINGSYVRANLVEGPIVGGESTITISGFDANNYGKRSICLNNRTIWAIADSDFGVMDNWQAGDPVIIGHNDAWFTCNHAILINVVTNSYVRARKL